jgi:hypothetical protein
MKLKTPIRPPKPQTTRDYVMRIADLLSDDPMLLRVIGPKFKVMASYDLETRRVTYSFRHVDDVAADELEHERI